MFRRSDPFPFGRVTLIVFVFCSKIPFWAPVSRLPRSYALPELNNLFSCFFHIFIAGISYFYNLKRVQHPYLVFKFKISDVRDGFVCLSHEHRNSIVHETKKVLSQCQFSTTNRTRTFFHCDPDSHVEKQ
jgi:hypothetical protein